MSSRSFAVVLAVVGSVCAFAPAGQPVEFQITVPSSNTTFCLSSPTGLNNGEPVHVINCASTFPSTHQWTVDRGGASTASGTGPASQIRIFGGKCLDVTNGLNQNGNKLQIWDCGTNGNNNQLFNVNGDGSIHWAPNGGSKCVDLTGGSVDASNEVQLWDCAKGNTNQLWNALPVPLLTGEKIHWNPNDQTTALCITAASSTPGSPITLGPCGNPVSPSNNTFSVPASGEGPIETFNNALCLDVKDGKNADGNPVQAWTCAGNANQLWVSSRTSTGTVIQWAGTDKCLDVTGGKNTTGNPLQIWTCGDANPNQMWFEVPDF